MSNCILITGALGHIGSKLIHSIKPGDFEEVHMIDDLSTQRYTSLFNLPKDVDFSFIEDDILKADMNSLTRDIDVVLHLAAITDAPASFERRKEVEQVNYKGTRRVAEACIETGTRLLFPSTTSVYGSQSKVVDETCPVEELKPQSPYAEYKLKSEQMLQEMAEEQELKFIICRFGTIFGTSIGMRFHTAVNKFCWQAIMGQPLTIWKTALDQQRPYLGVTDAVAVMKFIIKKNLFDCDIYNVVSSNNTVREIVDCIKKYISDIEVKSVDSKIMNQLSYSVRNDKIKAKGFIFNDNLIQGINQTLSILQ